MNLNMNFNTNLCKREYYKYFNLWKKYLINNANIHYNLKCRGNKIPGSTAPKSQDRLKRLLPVGRTGGLVVSKALIPQS